MNLSEMKQILAAGGIQLTRSLGQSFLHDNNQLRRIVKAAELTDTDRVLEIGPGLGPLTEMLVAQAGEVLAIEKDRRLADCLRQRHASARNLTLLEADALEYLRSEPRDWSGWKLVANLPYSVASPILVELAQAREGPERMAATLQLEVARRLLARPGAKDYGVLTLLIQLDYEPQGWFKIPASCFFPAPEVDSACVSLRRRAHPLLPPDQRPVFAGLVKRGFSQRRKMMLKVLKTDWEAKALEQAFASVGLQPQVRAETVSLEQFVRLTQCLGANSADG
jgi:16S rRNA (adenine1518-N6/adenine1519-N6)-dimethyltransferase